MITIECMSWTCRIGEENEVFPSPFTDACRIDKCAPDTVRITALARNITLAQAIELRQKLKSMGFKYVVWERYKEGQFIDVKKEL